eukprot:SAG22_NODE_15266_length_353_cov_0.409449_1_plen_33_part_10
MQARMSPSPAALAGCAGSLLIWLYISLNVGRSQ